MSQDPRYTLIKKIGLDINLLLLIVVFLGEIVDDPLICAKVNIMSLLLI